MVNLNEDDRLVKKTFRETYDFSLYDELGFFSDGPYRPSLEETVRSWGLPPKMSTEGMVREIAESTDDQMRFTANHCPELVSSTIWNLRGKHKNIPTQAAAQRFVSRAGVIILERISGLKTITDKKRLAYETGEEKDRLRFRNFPPYYLGHRLSLTDFRVTCYTFQWVGSKIVEVASDLGLSQELIVTEALISGMTTSEEWIPARHRDVMFDEMIRFAAWVNEFSEKV